MIHWQWLLLAVFIGFCFGLFIMAVLAASGRASRMEEIIEHNFPGQDKEWVPKPGPLEWNPAGEFQTVDNKSTDCKHKA